MPIPPKPLPDIAILRSVFRYDPDTGAIWNLVSRTNRRAGDRAECLGTKGYLSVHCSGRNLQAHRVAWFLHHETQPLLFIDHIDGDKQNNKISNLRLAEHHMNMCNRSAPPHNTSGFRGVSRHGKNWRGFVTVNRKRTNLGTFADKADAAAAVREARLRLHGDFFRD